MKTSLPHVHTRTHRAHSRLSKLHQPQLHLAFGSSILLSFFTTPVSHHVFLFPYVFIIKTYDSPNTTFCMPCASKKHPSCGGFLLQKQSFVRLSRLSQLFQPLLRAFRKSILHTQIHTPPDHLSFFSISFGVKVCLLNSTPMIGCALTRHTQAPRPLMNFCPLLRLCFPTLPTIHLKSSEVCVPAHEVFHLCMHFTRSSSFWGFVSPTVR